ncbi:MAG TPA: 2'-5' RNA ligase family protein [Gemmatimonadaceae bacterium]|nr:2'-5' RNA ligase family protein [Gemmatimonadaceae bacterium]
MSRAKSGIFVIAPIGGEAGARIAALQRQYDPRLAALDQAPHVTLAGSSGMGPIAPDVTPAELEAALGPIARETVPLTLRFGRPTRFMQTQIVVLPLDPHGPLRTLHERIKTSGLRAARPRFYFTPHVTLNLYRELPRELLLTLLAERFDEPITIDTLEAHLTKDTGESRKLVTLSLQGGNQTP